MFVLITGAAGGLGRAFANACAEKGYNLLLTDINDVGLSRIARGISNLYPVTVLTCPCDLTSEQDVDALFTYARDNGARFEMLLNIAGIDYEGGFAQRSSAAITSIVRLNVEATLRVTHKLLANREPAKPLSIVFVSSLASFYPMPLKATYAASKSFLREFAYALAQELRSQDVNVLTLCPGGLPTTQEALSGIAAQGFWGEVTTNGLETVTRQTLSRALNGRSIYIPGFFNKVFRTVGTLLPKRLIARLIYARWHEVQQEWLSV